MYELFYFSNVFHDSVLSSRKEFAAIGTHPMASKKKLVFEVLLLYFHEFYTVTSMLLLHY